MKQDILKRYSDFTCDYDKFRPMPPEDLIITIKNLSKKEVPEVVVDLGSGTGLSTRIWSSHANKIIGIEPSEDMINEAKKKTKEKNVDYIIGFGNKTGLPDKYADIVTASSSIHWMEPKSTADELGRLLHKGGVFGAYGYKYPLFLNEWKLHVNYKEFRINLDDLEKMTLSNSLNKYHWQDIKYYLKQSNYFRLLEEFNFHKIIKWKFSDFNGWIYTHAAIPILQNKGLTDNEIGLKKLFDNAKILFSDRSIPVLFSYKLLIGIR